MNGKFTGYLFLISDGTGQVNWISAKSGKKSGWHGRWGKSPHNVQELHVEFDFEGKEFVGKYVWLRPLQGGRPGVFHGQDHENRRVVATHIRTWRKNANGNFVPA